MKRFISVICTEVFENVCIFKFLKFWLKIYHFFSESLLRNTSNSGFLLLLLDLKKEPNLSSKKVFLVVGGGQSPILAFCI